MSFIKGAAEVITGYGSQIKAADDFNDKVGGKDSLVGRGIASFDHSRDPHPRRAGKAPPLLGGDAGVTGSQLFETVM